MLNCHYEHERRKLIMANESSWFISNVVSNNKDQYLITLDETGDNYEAIPLKGTGKTYKREEVEDLQKDMCQKFKRIGKIDEMINAPAEDEPWHKQDINKQNKPNWEIGDIIQNDNGVTKLIMDDAVIHPNSPKALAAIPIGGDEEIDFVTTNSQTYNSLDKLKSDFSDYHDLGNAAKIANDHMQSNELNQDDGPLMLDLSGLGDDSLQM